MTKGQKYVRKMYEVTHTFSYFYIFLLHTFSLHIFAPLSLYISMSLYISIVFKRFKGEVFNAFIKVIPNFYSCKANVEFTIVCFDGIDVIGRFRSKPSIV